MLQMKKQLCIKAAIFTVFVVITTVCIVIGNGLYQNQKLFNAVLKDDYTGAETAIKKGAWINARKHLLYLPNLIPTNPTPLIAACKSGNHEIVMLLIDNGANINRKDNYTKQTPLLAALNTRNANRYSLAMTLIENGADIFCIQPTTSPLEETLIVLDSDSEQTIQEGFDLFKYLLQKQVHMDIVWGTENALTFAAHYNNANAVAYLIEEGYFNVNSYDKAGDTALIVAAKHNKASIVKLLVKLGANRATTDSLGKTALDYAEEQNYSEVIQILKEHGAT